jgi:HAE1 family hydrophobic/amphiphilic exporter-1
MAAAAVVMALTAVLFVVIPKGFIPDQDTDQISVITEAAQGTSYTRLTEYQNAVADIVRRNPNVDALVASVGGATASTLGGPNLGQLVVHLKPRSERATLANDIIEQLRPELARIPGLQVYLQNPPIIRIGGQVSKSLYQYSVQGPSSDAVAAAARQLASALAKAPGMQDVTSDVAVANPQINVDIDRDLAAALGVTAGDIENAFYDAYGPRWVSTIYGPNNEYKVLLELAPEFQTEPSSLSMLYFKSSANALVPLETLTHAAAVIGPQAINHNGQLPAATVSFALAPGASLGDVLARVRQTAAATLPPGVAGEFQGSAAAFQSSLGDLAALLVIAILVVYIVLGILYESYIHPITILSGLPSAAVGALLTLMIFHMDLNIYAFVGIIMLIGIVKKNAIMQIDFALEAERRGMSSEEAIYQGCLVRFRPIMMTTMAALLGAVPIAVGYGAGGEARQSLGVVVVGGLLFSQLVTLYLTPVFYTYMAHLQGWLGRRSPKRLRGISDSRAGA